jgi:hypothetical protein
MLPEYVSAMGSLEDLDRYLEPFGKSIRGKPQGSETSLAAPVAEAGRIRTETAPATVAAAAGDGPRRRKPVRGGNKREDPVLPEFEDALAALGELDSVLDEQGALNQALEAISASNGDITGKRVCFQRQGRGGGGMAVGGGGSVEEKQQTPGSRSRCDGRRWWALQRPTDG